MFIRFATNKFDCNNKPFGVFGAAYGLSRDENLPDYSREEILTTLNWFSNNLPIPDRFVNTQRPHRQDNGICWFKSEAKHCLKQVRYLAQLVSEHEILVRELRTKTPGYIIYEDEFQLVAKPFSSCPD